MHEHNNPMTNLILSRRAGESILLGDTIEITVLVVDGCQARISIQAPRDVHIVRAELKTRDAEATGKLAKHKTLIRHKLRRFPK